MLRRLAITIEATLHRSATVITYDLDTVQLSLTTGYVEGEIRFIDGSRLVFFEFLRQTYAKIVREKYRYQFMDNDDQLIFRYDDAPHHPEIATFPHHKHLPTGLRASVAPQFPGVFAEAESHILGIP